MTLLRIGITQGDINGIGYEMLIKVLQEPEMLEVCTPVIFGCSHILQSTAQHLGIDTPPLHIISQADHAIDGHINLVEVCTDAVPELQFGQQTEAALQAEAQSLTAALQAYSHRSIDLLITLPGHLDNDDQSHALTDFIRQAYGSPADAFHWYCNGPLRAMHMPKIDVSTQLGEGLASEAFQRQVTTISHCLRQDFGDLRPRLAVITRDPRLHNDILELRQQGILVFGPFAANEFVEEQRYTHYDGCIFMGEGESLQGMFSLADADFTYGYVSGLPLVLAYPIAGISYDIAGLGQANAIPLRQAIFAAIDIQRTRQSHLRATRHPLEKQWIPRGRDDFKLDLTKEE